MKMGANRLRVLLWGLLVAVAVGGSGCVSASEGKRMRQDLETLDARLTELSASLQNDRSRLTALLETAEAEIALLRGALQEAEQLLHRNSADLGLQLDTLASDVDGLRGQLEHADFRLSQLQEQLNLFMEEVDLRLSPRRR
jgi:chromosome segregation ATPase